MFDYYRSTTTTTSMMTTTSAAVIPTTVNTNFCIQQQVPVVVSSSRSKQGQRQGQGQGQVHGQKRRHRQREENMFHSIQLLLVPLSSSSSSTSYYYYKERSSQQCYWTIVIRIIQWYTTTTTNFVSISLQLVVCLYLFLYESSTTTTTVHSYQLPSSSSSISFSSSLRRNIRYRHHHHNFHHHSLWQKQCQYEWDTKTIGQLQVSTVSSTRRTRLYNMLEDSSSSSSTIITTNFEQYTVKELRQLVKDLPLLERGTLSKLTRKQDLISFLITSQQQQQALSSTVPKNKDAAIKEQIRSENPTSNDRTSTEPAAATTRRKTLGTSQMAPIPMNTILTAKDSIIEEVYKRYPPVREQQFQLQQQQEQQQQYQSLSTPSSTNIEDDDDHNDDETTTSSLSSSKLDVRQQYHPIFRHLSTKLTTANEKIEQQDSIGNVDTNNADHDAATATSAMSLSSSMFSSSDMDLIFVGTASCTPGVTRGTSCTALRLNWQRGPKRIGLVQPKNTIVNTSSTGQRYQTQTHDNTNRQQQQPSYYSSSVTAGTWLFDVGECTQLQIQRTASIKPSKITKIFITHAHGDHSFGLPGLLCVMGTGNQNRDMNVQNSNNNGNNEPQPIEIYGPEGLRMWLRVAIRYSVSRIVPPYVVHELMDLPMAPEWEFNRRFKRYYYNGFQQQQQEQQNGRSSRGRWGSKGLAGEDPSNWISQANILQLDPSPQYGEVDGGRNIYPEYNHPKSHDGAPVWNVIQDETVSVYAAPMSHTIPCVGYCIDEAPRPGRLKNEIVEPIVQRNLDALRKAGFHNPMKVMGILKNLKPNTAFTFPDGTIVTQNDAVEAARKGRKVVICGDTCDSRAMITLAKDADVVVHEATNAFLPGVDTKKDLSYHDVTRDCIIHGHSTPQMAGDFCRKVNGKQLILNHFSARYKGDVSADSLSIMMRIEKLAMRTSRLDESNVAAAWDFMILPIQQNE